MLVVGRVSVQGFGVHPSLVFSKEMTFQNREFPRGPCYGSRNLPTNSLSRVFTVHKNLHVNIFKS